MKLTTLIRIALATGVLSTQFSVFAEAKTDAKSQPDKTIVSKPVSLKDVIAEQEAQKGIPQDLLRAIAKIESGLSPWAINANGRAHMFRSKEAAARYVRELVNLGTTNFSVGCMQLHYASHRRHFQSVEAMLEPQNNIAHAAKLIKSLERRHGSLERAIKHYHSASPAHHNPYKNRVYGMWAKFGGGKKLSSDSTLKTVAFKKTTSKKAVKPSKRVKNIKFSVGVTPSKTTKDQKA